MQAEFSKTNTVSASKTPADKSTFYRQNSRTDRSTVCKQNSCRQFHFPIAKFSQTNQLSASKIHANIHFLQTKFLRINPLSANKILANKFSFREQNSRRQVHFQQAKFYWTSSTSQAKFSVANVQFSQGKFCKKINFASKFNFACKLNFTEQLQAISQSFACTKVFWPKASGEGEKYFFSETAFSRKHGAPPLCVQPKSTPLLKKFLSIFVQHKCQHKVSTEPQHTAYR